MKKFNFELTKDEDAIKLILPLKKNAKSRIISIHISENLEYIGHTTLQKLKNYDNMEFKLYGRNSI